MNNTSSIYHNNYILAKTQNSSELLIHLSKRTTHKLLDKQLESRPRKPRSIRMKTNFNFINLSEVRSAAQLYRTQNPPQISGLMKLTP